MRSHPFRILPALLVSSLVSWSSWAAPACSGDACEALTVSADGCQWKNTSAQAVKFTVYDTSTTLFQTVLGPGEGFKLTNPHACVSGSPSGLRYQAIFASLRKMPDAPDFTLKKPAAAATTTTTAAAAPAKPAVPRAKPSPVAPEEPATQLASVPATAPTLAPAPTPKPATPKTPVPRSKPEAPSLTTTAALPTAPPTVEVLHVPTEAEIAAGASPCGEACGEILFKSIDNCLWVQSQNPKPIVFQATIAGQLSVLLLEGASYEKSSATPTQGSSAYHTRQRDPFQSSSAGIPVYRARLNNQGACVNDKTQITQFVAAYKQ